MNYVSKLMGEGLLASYEHYPKRGELVIIASGLKPQEEERMRKELDRILGEHGYTIGGLIHERRGPDYTARTYGVVPDYRRLQQILEESRAREKIAEHLRRR